MFEKVTRRELLYVGIFIGIMFVVLLAMEYLSHRTDTFFDVPLNLMYEKYPNIGAYLHDVEEPQLADLEALGCYDNDPLLEDIKGQGQTCKTWAPKVIDINYKKPTNATIPANKADSYFSTSDGRSYSFAEICPVTTNQELPIKCLYRKSAAMDNLNNKLSGLISQVQTQQRVTADNLDDAISYHIVDNNRLANVQHVKEFLAFENKQGMNRGLRRSTEDYIDDLNLYAKNKKKMFATTS